MSSQDCKGMFTMWWQHIPARCPQVYPSHLYLLTCSIRKQVNVVATAALKDLRVALKGHTRVASPMPFQF